MHKKFKTKIVFLFGLALILSLTGLRCTKAISPEAQQANKPVVLQWWRVYDDETAVRPMIEAYQALHPNVTIQYRKLRYDEYENELLDALAEDRGPDIISLHNTWIREYQSKLAPLPPTLTIPYQEVIGKFKKEVVITLKTAPTLSTRVLKNDFVDVVAKDVLIANTDAQGQVSEQIYGLPMALDALVLYTNRDLLNLGGVPQAPKTWSELQNVVKKLTTLDQQGDIIQSGAALGSSRNVERSADILSLLMMQNLTEMIDESGQASFHRVPRAIEDRPVPPGQEALIFYTDFANPQKQVYTWSADFPSSLEAFLAGKTALFFGYSYHLSLIRARAPRLNLEIASVPQIEGNPQINFANYWIETVSRKSVNQHWAWDFLQFITSAQKVGTYLNATKKPTALRGLISAQLENEDIGVFASQVLTATSWYKGKDSLAAEQALLDAIDATLAGAEVRDILNVAAQRVNQTLR